MDSTMLKRIYEMVLKETGMGIYEDLDFSHKSFGKNDIITIRNHSRELEIHITVFGNVKISFSPDYENKRLEIVSEDFSDIDYYIKKIYGKEEENNV